MTANPKPRVQAGVREGGQFATAPKSEAAVSLRPASTSARLDVNAKVELDTSSNDPVPDWPASLGAEPSISYERDIEGSDSLVLSVENDTVGTVQFWGTAGAEHSFDFGLYEGEPISGKERDAVIAYGRALYRNVDILHLQLEDSVTSPVRDDVVALALGRPTASGSQRSLEPATFGAQRAATVMKAWVDDVDVEPQTALKDALTDLVHFARSRGLDIEDVLADAQQMADAEAEEEQEIAGLNTEGA